MIPGVELKQLTRHPMGERGYWFAEIGRFSDPFFTEGVKQWSRTRMQTGLVKAWHIHQKQVDWWVVESGLVKAVVCGIETHDQFGNPFASYSNAVQAGYRGDLEEFILGDDQPPAILKIPPGVAHGLKVLQGPAVLSYLTSQEYDPDDEGRIPYDALGYDWFKVDIR